MAADKPWIDPSLPVIGLTETQIVLVTLYGEARSEPLEGMAAVACVIRNRVKSRGQDWRKVCLAPWQFSCWNEVGGARNYARVVGLVKRLFAGESLVEDTQLRELAYIAHGAMKDLFRDTTKGATHYHTATLLPRPAWAQTVVPVCQRGSHVFYAGVK